MGRTFHIIGSGISGLFCAKFIKETNPDVKTIIYEAAPHAGGRAYSYDDTDLQCRLDNATHVIIGANKNLSRFVPEHEWNRSCRFWNRQDDTLSSSPGEFKSHIIKSCCNLAAENAAPKIIKKIMRLTFPWTEEQRKIYFSKNNLSQQLINPLLSFADECFFNTRFLKTETQFGRVAALTFNNRSVDLGADDRVILALSSRAFRAVYGGEAFDYSSIINIFYRTSQKITLPKSIDFMAAVQAKADWIFVSDKIVGITISDASSEDGELETLARSIWKELDILRGVNSAFVPPFKIFNHKTATIRQDAANNAKRPDSALTEYPNLFIAGDWTMKDYPCSMETAALSAKRAVKAAFKA